MTTHPSPLINDLLNQLSILSRENSKTMHPDPGIRKFDRALMDYLKHFPNQQKFIQDIIQKRPDLTTNQFSSMLPRAAQYLLRKKNIDNYCTYKDNQWLTETIPELFKDENFKLILLTKKHSTTRPYHRYRSLSAILNQINKPVLVYDWGCSINLGLAGLFIPNFFNKHPHYPAIKDLTPNQLLTKCLARSSNNIVQGVGIDLQHLNSYEGLEWVCACEYFENYDQTFQILKQDFDKLQKHQNKLLTLSYDVSSPGLIDYLIPQPIIKNEMTVIYASMMMYQLSPERREQTLANAAKILPHDGLFVELNFIDEKKYYKSYNIHTTVRFMNDNLSQSYEWLLWKDHLCSTVKPGKDFNQINQKLDQITHI